MPKLSFILICCQKSKFISKRAMHEFNQSYFSPAVYLLFKLIISHYQFHQYLCSPYDGAIASF